GLAEITYYKALVYDRKEDYINAINTFKKSQQLYLKSHDTINVARIYGNLGLVEIKRGNYQDGLKYSLIATKELEKRNLRTELSKNYKNLAQAYLNTRDYDRAIEYNLKTLYLEEQSGLKNESTIYDVYKDLALLYAYKNENRKALEYYGKLVDNGVTLTDEERASILPLMANEYF
ncbi:MAG: tetratricopeptide repeat protein, partial [Flavobacteriaceae bacterium]|nr:tetratricopeptide repeat protein [Flavobacteriaceae bacterium]